MNLPMDSFARKIVGLKGWTPDEMANEVSGLDGVTIEEATRRVEEAQRQRLNRIVGQKLRHAKKRIDEKY